MSDIVTLGTCDLCGLEEADVDDRGRCVDQFVCMAAFTEPYREVIPR
jgi:hypothetical protein